jgi:hypothetical protein
MVGQGLRQLQEALNRKADAVQREFITIGEKLLALNRKLLEARGDERQPLLDEQSALHARQETLAGEINLWRDMARAVLHQRSDDDLRAYLRELTTIQDETVKSAVDHALFLVNASEGELARMAQTQKQTRPSTPVGRLIERARTEFDLRAEASVARQKAAFEFANRPRMAQDESALAELEAAVADKDPLVAETVTFTLIQMHRFRATRLADLDVVHASVERLTQIKHPAVVPALIEIMEMPRTGYAQGKGGMVDSNNLRSRLAAMACLAEWGTPEARAAIQKRQFDRDAHIAEAAATALATPAHGSGT